MPYFKKQNQVRAFVCFYPGCGTKFAHVRARVHHHAVHRTRGEFLFICERCNAGFRFSHQLMRHEVIAHDEPLPFVCRRPGCFRRFSEDKLRQRHRLLCQPRPDAVFPSSSVENASRDDNFSNSEVKVCLDNNVPAVVQHFPVREDSRGTSINPAALENQSLAEKDAFAIYYPLLVDENSVGAPREIDKPEKFFNCRTCNFPFGSHKEAVKHYFQVHREAYVKVFACPFPNCVKVYRAQHSRLVHMRRKHGGENLRSFPALETPRRTPRSLNPEL